MRERLSVEQADGGRQASEARRGGGRRDCGQRRHTTHQGHPPLHGVQQSPGVDEACEGKQPRWISPRRCLHYAHHLPRRRTPPSGQGPKKDRVAEAE